MATIRVSESITFLIYRGIELKTCERTLSNSFLYWSHKNVQYIETLKTEFGRRVLSIILQKKELDSG